MDMFAGQLGDTGSQFLTGSCYCSLQPRSMKLICSSKTLRTSAILTLDLLFKVKSRSQTGWKERVNEEPLSQGQDPMKGFCSLFGDTSAVYPGIPFYKISRTFLTGFAMTPRLSRPP
jgi:hypothetical protein